MILAVELIRLYSIVLYKLHTRILTRGFIFLIYFSPVQASMLKVLQRLNPVKFLSASSSTSIYIILEDWFAFVWLLDRIGNQVTTI